MYPEVIDPPIVVNQKRALALALSPLTRPQSMRSCGAEIEHANKGGSRGKAVSSVPYKPAT